MEWLFGLVWVFQKCWSTGIFSEINYFRVLQRMVRKRKNFQWAAVAWMKMPCWCQRSEDNGVIDYRKANNHSVTTKVCRITISEHTTRRTLKQDGPTTAEGPHRVPTVPVLRLTGAALGVVFLLSLNFSKSSSPHLDALMHLTCCHVIGWLAICVTKHLNRCT